MSLPIAMCLKYFNSITATLDNTILCRYKKLMDKSANDAAARIVLISKRDSETKALENEKAAFAESQARSQARIESHANRIKLLNEMIAEMSGNSHDGSLPLAGMGKYSKMTTREGIMDILSQARGES